MTLLLNLYPLIGYAFLLPILCGLLVSGLWRSIAAWRQALMAILIAALYFSVIYYDLGDVVPLQHSAINWFGKLGAILLLAALYAALPQHIQAEVGLTRLPRMAYRPSTLFVAGMTLLVFVYSNAVLPKFFAHICQHPNHETLLFAATLPGLDEELAFRGILLAVLVSTFGKPWRLLGISIGWGAIAVITLFGLAHGYEMAAQGAPWPISLLVTIISTVMGALLLWLKERTGSIWLGIVLHNLANVLAALICS